MEESKLQQRSRSPYYAMITAKGKSSMGWEHRYHLVEVAKAQGVSAAAIAFGTSRPTIYKWMERFAAQGPTGLFEEPRRPRKSPRKIPRSDEEEILKLRRKHSRWGARRLKTHFDLALSRSTIERTIRRHALTRKKRKKWLKRKDLSLIKAKLKPFEKIQVDTKHLDDIPEYLPALYRHELPRFEWTARDRKTGGTFMGYSWALSLEGAKEFADKLLAHLKGYGVNLEGVTIQTDHGSEFDMAQPSHWVEPSRSAFVRKVLSFGARYQAIPIKRPTFNSDVEWFHGCVEEEFFEPERMTGLKDFRSKNLAYSLYFNCARKNSNKQDQSPLDIVKREAPGMDERVFTSWYPPLIGPTLKEKEEKERTEREEKEKPTLLSLLDTLYV